MKQQMRIKTTFKKPHIHFSIPPPKVFKSKKDYDRSLQKNSDVWQYERTEGEEMSKDSMKVIFQKTDLDTCLTALILQVNLSDEIAFARKGGTNEELLDPNVLCIEAGGSGMVEKNNYDHHDPDRYFPPACKQALNRISDLPDDTLTRLVEYVCMVDEAIPILPPVAFPSLSNIFSGMLLVETDPVVQLLAGMQILKTVWDNRLDPFASIPERHEWAVYITAKMLNQREIESNLKNARILASDSGIQMAYLESKHIGGIGACYHQGCQVVILFNPVFGNPPMRKFTIAGNKTRVGHLKKYFDAVEPGWGGRDTILGSPWTGSNLSEEIVIQIVQQHL